MSRRSFIATFILAITIDAMGQPTAHRSGPNGLEGWLVRERVATLENQGPLPTSLVIARDGKMIRRLKMHRHIGPFYWNFVFLSDGKQVAFEHGSLHFNLTCTLMDIGTGKRLQDYDCFQPAHLEAAPTWVNLLEATPRPEQ